MKKIHFLVLLSVVLFSCRQTELQFSCDPVIDAYVTNNRLELAQITVTELSGYEVPLQRAVFNSWEPEKKRSAWLGKLNYVLKNEAFNDDEIKHVQKLIDHIQPGYFEENLADEELLEHARFAEEWIGFAQNQLDWPKQFIAFMVYRLYVNRSQLEAELSDLASLKSALSTDSETGNCGCNTSEDFCGTMNCISTGCTTSSGGCGWLFAKSCNGNCFG